MTNAMKNRHEPEEASELAAARALEQLVGALDAGRSFVFEAGAGAGKTHSLVYGLRHLINGRGPEFLANGQQIACISYTNVASQEIETRTGGHPVVKSSTIHSFCWSLLSPFQKALRTSLPAVPKWAERIAEAGTIEGRRVEYELGHPKIKNDTVLLGHNDVILLMATFLEHEKFRKVLLSRFPIIFIDEYQDTNREFTNAILNYFGGGNDGPLIGFFGDHWQKIYDDGCGAIPDSSLVRIDKGANFRSAPEIVRVLNAMRPELPQIASVTSSGTADVYHTNEWTGTRLDKSHWKNDLPPDIAHQYLEQLRTHLASRGWDFSPETTKILMLTHNVLAKEQGYGGIAAAFKGQNERFVKKEDVHIGFLVDVIEPACVAYEDRKFGAMFEVLGTGLKVSTVEDKMAWKTDMDRLIQLRESGTVGDVLDHVAASAHLHLPDKVEEIDARIRSISPAADAGVDQGIEQIRELRMVRYSEVTALSRFINERSPFATKHGVKGAEYENVLVVVGRGWNKFDFNQLLEWYERTPSSQQEAFERNRNLFYVAVSRPRKRLALLFTEKVSPAALAVLRKWFGGEHVHAAP